ncbi:MAG: PTS sugar transporter subunit IIC [Clostridia bacterium]|nr:PTS sugar transporter subunit IIC [Clostridia bacterium]
MRKIKELANRYFIDGLGAMALGLFATLIIGTIIGQLGVLVSRYISENIGTYFASAATVAKAATGAGIGVAVAVKYKQSPLLAAAAGVCGMLGAHSADLSKLASPGEPLGAFVAALIGIEIGRLVSGKTKLDIVLTPLVTIAAGSVTAFLVSGPISSFMTWLGSLVNISVDAHPVIGGVIVSTLMGIFLTLPISSAAIGISLGLSGLAAGAAVVGCSCQMIGFAVTSYRDNGFGGFIAQGVGTSMIQIPNIIRKPTIWIAPTLASAVLGPISSAVLKMTNTPSGSGMGTSGLVGQIQAFSEEAGMVSKFGSVQTLIFVLCMHVIAPAVLALIFDLVLRKIGWVSKGDMKLGDRDDAKEAKRK